MPEPAEQVKVILNETRSGSIVRRRKERKERKEIYVFAYLAPFALIN